jgi:hypothetical protein
MKEMKPVMWTLDTVTNVKRITTEEIMKLDLKDRQIAIFPNVDGCVGATVIDKGFAYTNNEFPIIGDSGIIQMVDENKDGVSFRCIGPEEKHCFFTPKHSDMVFIIEKDDDTKGKWLKPEYAWRPDEQTY